MTDDEFQRRYHDFATLDHWVAEREATQIVLENGRHPAVVGLPFQDGYVRYCLMLPEAAKALTGLYPELEGQ